MTASSWQGGRALAFRGIMTQHNEDFNHVINALQQVADKGKAGHPSHRWPRQDAD